MTGTFRGARLAAMAGLAAGLSVFSLAASLSTARAQTVVATANDDPITNVDIEQHAKMLRVLRKPATPQAALDDVIDTRLKLIETAKFKIVADNGQMAWAMGFAARELKTDPQQLAAALQRAGVANDQIEQKFKSEAAWMMYIRALNRTLEISENDVQAELSKQGGGKALQYSIRQVVFVLPNGATGAVVEQRGKAAQALRAQFSSCAAGEAQVRAAQDAVFQPAVTRSSSSLTPELRKLLDSTPVGHLTAPQRGPEGIVMLAVCDKSQHADANAEETVRGELLNKRLQGVSDRKFAEVKSRAIIVKK